MLMSTLDNRGLHTRHLDGFQALNSKNLATVNAASVVRPKRHFDTLTLYR